MTSAEELDRAIDDVARAMTSAAPSPHLRARVVGHLQDRRTRRWEWWMAPVLAGAAVAVLVAALRGVPRVPSPPTVGSVSGVPRALAAPDPSRGPGEFRVAHPTPVVPAPSAEELAWQDRAIPALARPDALAMDDIQPTALEIRPLVTTPLEVSPIGAGLRDGSSPSSEFLGSEF